MEHEGKMKKYEFTGETKQILGGPTLRRIRRLSDNLIGGWIESEKNLAQEGKCWVHEDAQVYSNARVTGNAQLYNASLFGDTWIHGDMELAVPRIGTDVVCECRACEQDLYDGMANDVGTGQPTNPAANGDRDGKTASTDREQDNTVTGHWSARVYDDKTEALMLSFDITDLVASHVLDIAGLHLADNIICLEIERIHHALVMREIPELQGVRDGQSIFIERHSGETWFRPSLYRDRDAEPVKSNELELDSSNSNAKDAWLMAGASESSP
jgi:hypothetical protein